MAVRICSRDWQDLLDKLERIAQAAESIATSLNVNAKLEQLAKHAGEEASALGRALPQDAPKP